MWLSDGRQDMHGLGGVGFQKVIHQPVQQHGASLFKDNRNDILNEFVKMRTRTHVSWCRRTGVELLVDKASDLFELLEVGGLQEWEEVPHVGLLSGHGGGSAGGGGRTSLTQCQSWLAWRTPGVHPPTQSPGTSADSEPDLARSSDLGLNRHTKATGRVCS